MFNQKKISYLQAQIAAQSGMIEVLESRLKIAQAKTDYVSAQKFMHDKYADELMRVVTHEAARALAPIMIKEYVDQLTKLRVQGKPFVGVAFDWQGHVLEYHVELPKMGATIRVLAP